MGSIIITGKIQESMLKSFVEIEFEICSIYKAQCAEENSPLKFTQLFQETRDTRIRGRMTEQFCKMLIA